MKKRLIFKNENIKRYKSTFKKDQDRVYTSFRGDRNTKYKGLGLCKYRNKEKYFVVSFRLRGERNRGPRIFPVGRFDLTKNPKTGEIRFGTEQCEKRLWEIIKTHCDSLGRWLKNPNETVRFNKIIKSKSIGEVIEAYCKKGFPKIGSEENIKDEKIRGRVWKSSRNLIGIGFLL